MAATTPDKMDESGGVGGAAPVPLISDPPKPSDCKLLDRCVKERWPITQEQRELVLTTMETLVRSCDDPRVKVSAGKVLVSIDRLNIQDKPQRHEHSGPDGSSIPLQHSGKVEIDVFAEIDRYTAEFAAAAARKAQDADEEAISAEDMALAGFAPPKHEEPPCAAPNAEPLKS